MPPLSNLALSEKVVLKFGARFIRLDAIVQLTPDGEINLVNGEYFAVTAAEAALLQQIWIAVWGSIIDMDAAAA